ncbi:MAG: hypothetical protein ACKPA9_14215, partial [Microcystis sp.]
PHPYLPLPSPLPQLLTRSDSQESGVRRQETKGKRQKAVFSPHPTPHFPITPHPTPYTPHPTPHTPHPTPHTPHPNTG